MKTRRSFLALGLVALVALAPVAFAQDTHVKAEKPAHIAMGQKVDIADYIVPGKTTIFDFTSKYCGPCVQIAPMLDKLHAKRDDIAVVKVDINRPNVKGIDWQSPVVKQYGLRSVPSFKVFGPDGKLIAEGDKASTLVRSWLK